MIENIIIGVSIVGLCILIYYVYNNMKNTEKRTQEVIDKQIRADWEDVTED